MIFLKFEELRTDPREHLFDVFRFLLCKKDLSGTYVEHKIEEVLAKGHEATRSYAMKTTDGKFNAIDRFTPELQNHVKTELGPFCAFFDYFTTDTSKGMFGGSLEMSPVAVGKGDSQFFPPPRGLILDSELGNYRDATQQAIDLVDGMSLEERQSR